jgi:hypothetical protein
MKSAYIFDSSSIRVIGNYYPDHFPSFWVQFEQAVTNGEVRSVREVYKELSLQVAVTEKEIWKWVKEHKAMFLSPAADETTFVGEIFKVAHFKSMVGEQQRLKGSPVADPFLIASAKCCGGCVVTEEGKKPNAAKIPNVCDHFGISYTNVLGFLKQKKWKF